MRYTHDCDKCIPLGEHNDTDLYVCPASLTGPTVIARHSSHGPDYSSGLEFAHVNPALAEAKVRAEAAGLLPSNA